MARSFNNVIFGGFLQFSFFFFFNFKKKLRNLNGVRPKPIEDVESVEETKKVYINEFTGEIGGYQGPEPTRFGDWSHKGRCTDF